MQEPDYHDGEGPARRACDQCRLRKIRCDKDSPCANCKTANRACSSTGAGQRPKEARQRVLISTQYERKIDHFESRLENIENMIRDLAISIHTRSPSASATEPLTAGGYASSATAVGPGGNNPSPATTSTPTNTAGTANTTTTTTAAAIPDDDTSVSAFEGGSSMAAQTVFASEFLEHAVAHTLPPGLDPDMQSALMSLQQIVAMQNRPSAHESRFVHAKPLPPGGLRELPMPPAPVVVTALREMKKDGGLVSFASICLFVVGGNFAERCSKVYFATEDFNIMSWGVVNGGLFFLLQDKAAVSSGPERQQLLEYMVLCRDNLETALSNMPLLMPARKESIELLLMGAFYAIEISKFSVARDLTAAAATLCQTLGYHRISNDDEDDEDADPAAPVDTTAPARAILFWAAYLLDKALSMRSGRAPAIQDYDITVARGLDESIDMPDDSWRFVLNQWIAYADVLGKAYEQLYSPAALAAPLEQRSESARQLIQTMLNLSKKQEPLMRHTREKMRGVRFDAHSQFPMEMAILGDELTHWSSLTLVYRAMPSPPGSPSTFNPECIHAAREAFRCHQEYMDMAGDSLPVKAGCIRW
ncbi:hypothetical protein B0J18DRAFT_87516 [Chaetomium sp. MPI-SDFR-AT-0129]|nr:hypothetical protein B0J18DRAFT_87516 [Chaetomium sp. MPI-SDFR-AT-0129]